MSNIVKAERAAIIERVMLVGDLAKLTPQERVSYYGAVCGSLGLNPLTKPFDYLSLSGKLVLYANKGCAEQLRNIHNVTVAIVDRHLDESIGVYTVTARASKPNDRADEDVGSVVVKGLTGDALANATMKAHTKAKRRVTLSICGLSVLDESELESVPDARPIRVDMSTGEMIDSMPRAISPFHEADPERTYPTQDELEAVLDALNEAESFEAMRAALHEFAWRTPEEMERWAPDQAKAIGKLFNSRKRLFAKQEAPNAAE